MRIFYIILLFVFSFNTYAQQAHIVELTVDNVNLCLGEESVFTIANSLESVSYLLYETKKNKIAEISGNGGRVNFLPLKLTTGKYYIVSVVNNVLTKLSNDVYLNVHKPVERDLFVKIDKHKICEGEEVNISMSSYEDKVKYYLNAEGVDLGEGVLSDVNILVFPSQRPIVNTVYTIKAKGENCSSFVDILNEVTINVESMPSTDIDIISDKSEICKNESVVVSVIKSSKDVFYQLSNGVNFTKPYVVGDGSDIKFAPLSLDLSTSIKVAAFSAVCKDKTFLTKKINIDVVDYGDLPIDFIVSPGKVCAGDVFTISIPNSIKNKEYVLENTNTEIFRVIGNGGIVSIKNLHYRPNSNFEISLSVCSDGLVLASPKVEQVDIPVLKCKVKDISYRKDGEIKISVNGGTPPYKYKLSNSNSIVSTTDDVYVFKNLDQGLYSVSVVDGNNCSDNQELELEVKSLLENDIILNNIITPNKDGFNDVFKIEYNKDLGPIQVLIFNIYGQKVYFSNDYQNTWSGHGLTTGSYYYSIKFLKSDMKAQKGILTILNK